MTLEQIARLYVIFKTLEPEIKEWIASDDTAAIIKAIAARFVLSDEQERKLPILVLRLVTQDLPPESFKAELAKETGADENLAKGITEALAKEVIGPIAAALRYGGIDTNLLGFNAPPSTSPISSVRQAPTAQATEPVINQEQITKPKISEPRTAPSQPFILHEEPQTNKSAVSSAARSPAYEPNRESGKIPPRVVIERVVHYSQLRTPLNVAGINKNNPVSGRNAPKLPQSKWFV